VQVLDYNDPRASSGAKGLEELGEHATAGSLFTQQLHAGTVQRRGNLEQRRKWRRCRKWVTSPNQDVSAMSYSRPAMPNQGGLPHAGCAGAHRHSTLTALD